MGVETSVEKMHRKTTRWWLERGKEDERDLISDGRKATEISEGGIGRQWVGLKRTKRDGTRRWRKR